MMKTIFLFIAFSVSVTRLGAQSITQDVIATTGDSYTNTSAILSFTVGEPMTETLIGTNKMITQGFQQAPLTFWVGAISTAWENSLNWNPTILPDSNADVIILSSMARYPIINSNPFCATITMQPGTTATVNTGSNLTIKG